MLRGWDSTFGQRGKAYAGTACGRKAWVSYCCMREKVHGPESSEARPTVRPQMTQAHTLSLPDADTISHPLFSLPSFLSMSLFHTQCMRGRACTFPFNLLWLSLEQGEQFPLPTDRAICACMYACTRARACKRVQCLPSLSFLQAHCFHHFHAFSGRGLQEACWASQGQGGRRAGRARQ